jgi:hypothetical protein
MKQLTKVVIFRVFSVLKMVWNRFSSVFSSENGSEWNSEFFFLPKMVQNGIPKFSLLKMVWKGIPRFYHSKTEFQGFFSSKKWFGTEFRGFSLPRNRRNSDETPVGSVLFHIPRNNPLLQLQDWSIEYFDPVTC